MWVGLSWGALKTINKKTMRSPGRAWPLQLFLWNKIGPRAGYARQGSLIGVIVGTIAYKNCLPIIDQLMTIHRLKRIIKENNNGTSSHFNV